MGDKVDRATNRAVEAALLTAGTLADESGITPVTLARWRTGERGVDAKTALKVAKALKRRADRLSKLSKRLEAVAQAELED